MRASIGTIIALNLVQVSVFCLTADEIEAERSGWNADPNTQYHIQTDEGPERYFRFQTLNGQYRKEKRLADGTVIGTEGWLDPLGYLRIKDYIADGQGYRILKSKMIYVGKDRPVQEAVSVSKKVPAQSGILVKPRRPPNPFRQPALKDVSSNTIEVNTVTPLRAVVSTVTASPPISVAYDDLAVTTLRPRPFSTPTPYDVDDYSQPNTNYLSLGYGYRNSYVPSSYRNSYPYRISQPALAIQPPAYDKRQTQGQLVRRAYNGARNAPGRNKGLVDEYEVPYDGTHTTRDGFQYYLKTHYHEEERRPGDGSLGSFGYIDPFGIRRVVYYKTDANGGFIHKKNNRYVGFNAKPYDPAPDPQRIV